MYRHIILLNVLIGTLGADFAEAGITGSTVKAVTRKLAGEAAAASARKTATILAMEAAEKVAEEGAKAATRRITSAGVRAFGAVAMKAPHFADDLASISTRISGRNYRRLQILAPLLNESGQAVAIVSRLAKGNGDELIETLWKHREKIGTAAVVTGLLIHGDDIVNAGGEYVAKPVIDGTMQNVVAPMSRLLISGLILGVVIALVGLAASLFGGEATERVTGNLRRLMHIFSPH